MGKDVFSKGEQLFEFKVGACLADTRCTFIGSDMYLYVGLITMHIN